MPHLTVKRLTGEVLAWFVSKFLLKTKKMKQRSFSGIKKSLIFTKESKLDFENYNFSFFGVKKFQTYQTRLSNERQPSGPQILDKSEVFREPSHIYDSYNMSHTIEIIWC